MVIKLWTPGTRPTPPIFSSPALAIKSERAQDMIQPWLLPYIPQRILPLVLLLHEPIDLSAFLPINPYFTPLPDTVPIPVCAALTPPLTYWAALALLPPFDYVQSKAVRAILSIIKFTLAIVSIYTFAVLPFYYHVPGSAIFTYQLGLIGCFGAGRGFDVFFLSYPRVPRRIVSGVTVKKDDDKSVTVVEQSGKAYANELLNEQWPTKPHPRGVAARLWWGLDLMISMRGVGWDFATPDVRHDLNPWQPPSTRQLRRALLKLAPILFVVLAGLRAMSSYIDAHSTSVHIKGNLIRSTGIAALPFPLRPLFVACLGIALYILFDFGYTLISAIAIPVLRTGASIVQTGSPNKQNDIVPLPDALTHNVDFFPLLNPLGWQAVRSVRSFWSKAWHRLFHRAFLIYGIIPFRNAALQIEYVIAVVKAKVNGTAVPPHPFQTTPYGQPSASRYADPGRALRKGEGDWGKVLGAFVASGLIHAIGERAAMGGRIALPHKHVLLPSTPGTKLDSSLSSLAQLVPPFSGAGEMSFFVLNGVAVIVETVVAKLVSAYRAKHNRPQTAWYDIYVQLIWTLSVLLSTGELFVEGWITSGLINEITLIKS